MKNLYISLTEETYNSLVSDLCPNIADDFKASHSFVDQESNSTVNINMTWKEFCEYNIIPVIKKTFNDIEQNTEIIYILALPQSFISTDYIKELKLLGVNMLVPFNTILSEKEARYLINNDYHSFANTISQSYQQGSLINEDLQVL